MSRAGIGTPIIVRPSNNVYTALAGAAVLATLAAAIAVFVKASQLDFKIFSM